MARGAIAPVLSGIEAKCDRPYEKWLQNTSSRRISGLCSSSEEPQEFIALPPRTLAYIRPHTQRYLALPRLDRRGDLRFWNHR